MLFLPTAWTLSTELPKEAGIPKLWDTSVPIISETDELKSHPFSVHFYDLFLSKKTDLCAEIWNN